MAYSGGGAYEAQRRGIENKYTGDSTANAYGRFLSQQRGQRGLSDTTAGFERGYPSIRAAYGARGLAGGGINSGVKNAGMRQYVGDYQQNFARQQQDLTQGLQSYDLSQAQMDAWRQEELSNIDMQQTNEIATAAQQLEALRAYLGGI